MTDKKFYSRLATQLFGDNDVAIYCEGIVPKSGIRTGGTGDSSYAQFTVSLTNRSKTLEKLASRVGATVQTNEHNGNQYNYLNVVVFGANQVNYLTKHVGPGALVQLFGKLVPNEYNGKVSMQLIATMANVLKAGSGVTPETNATTEAAKPATNDTEASPSIDDIGIDIDVDDIPF